MPKQRQTCTRCSQRRQKCDRKEPCTRCVQNKEGHLCSTRWLDGYDPSVHRKYPPKPASAVSWQSRRSSSNTSPSATQVDRSAEGNCQDPHSSTERTSVSGAAALGDPNIPTKLPDLTIGALLSDKEQTDQPAIFNQSFDYVRSKGTSREANSAGTIPGCYSAKAKAAQIEHLQSILPSKGKLLSIINHYDEHMLYWIGGIYHGPTFRRTLDDSYGTSDTLDLQKLDWRWNALLFSVLSSGIIGSSESASMSWGFTIDDKIHLAREWGAATIACLNLGNYVAQYHICSVQAIYIMHAYEHLVGSSSQWVALRSVAVIIAKGLGLNKLGVHQDDSRIHELNPAEKRAFIERETGRRVWYSLACQEWLCATSQSAFTIAIQKRHFTTARPLELDEETMTPVQNPTTPTLTMVSNYFFDYAAQLLEFHNVMQDRENKDELETYALVLKYDGDMRALCARTIPKCLSPLVPFDPKWPRWVAWARKLHQASINHKVIMLHQHFLSKSFKDVRYTYTRWACATAAKNIINTFGTRETDEPQWWVEQAFVVTAGICLILDLFHRAETDPEAQDHQNCVQKAITWLQQYFTSSVAVHGVRLLMSLLQEYAKLKQGPKEVPTNLAQGFSDSALNLTTNGVLSGPRAEMTMPVYSDLVAFNDDPTQFNFDIDALGFEDLMDYMPVEGSLDSQVFFDSMFQNEVNI